MKNIEKSANMSNFCKQANYSQANHSQANSNFYSRSQANRSQTVRQANHSQADSNGDLESFESSKGKGLPGMHYYIWRFNNW